MKKIARSLGGKIVLSVLLVVSICAIGICTLCSIGFVQDGFYENTREELEDKLLKGYLDNLVQEFADKTFYSNVNGYSYRYGSNGILDPAMFEGVSIKMDTVYNSTYAVNSNYDEYENKNNCKQYLYGVTDLSKAGYDHANVSRNYAYSDMGTRVHLYKAYVYIEPAKISSVGIRLMYKLLPTAYRMRYAIYPIGITALIVLIFCFATLMHVAGRRPSDEELHAGVLEKVPYDLLVALNAIPLMIIGIIFLRGKILDGIIKAFNFIPEFFYLVAGEIFAIWTIIAIICLSMSFASRLKRHTLIKNALMVKAGLLIWKGISWLVKKITTGIKGLFQAISDKSITWNAVMLMVAVCLVEFFGIVIIPDRGLLIGVWFVEKILMAAGIIWLILMFKKLQNSGKMLAEGNLAYVTDTIHLVGDFKRHGENLNSISRGMSKAVESSVKSERMKTELITNVSHDIKTPLTSIINYANLIGNEPTDNEKITEYSEVLVRQSDKLKRLIEDLVEASKASTGNLEVSLMSCDATVFISQVSGEFQEKMENAGLQMVTNVPEKEVHILADSRRMWRVFDNLLNNICKYSLEGSRVYISLEEVAGNAIFTFKNTSREALNISEEELMERFVRGDSSRNTEGNGLGLSIAKSLVELQNGKMNISIDGDLFKVTVMMPLM